MFQWTSLISESIENFAFLLFFFFFCLFMAASTAYGSSQARGRIGAVTDGLPHSHRQRWIQVMSVTYTTANGNAGSLTH